ncbi:MAG: acylphosphatase [Gammaproteobacteria bacterium]|nr:acylphosphatase [Gammaproteobacteria bacterium]
MKSSIHFLVSGRVQGVCFRMHTRQQALQHDLTGWVRNLPDGCVEGIASGATTDLERLQMWLRRGPERALVTSIEVQAQSYQPFDDFLIK